jgi:hypothetical protein
MSGHHPLAQAMEVRRCTEDLVTGEAVSRPQYSVNRNAGVCVTAPLSAITKNIVFCTTGADKMALVTPKWSSNALILPHFGIWTKWSIFVTVNRDHGKPDIKYLDWFQSS